MGYWAKDGAYVHDNDDVNAMEAMNETQGQAYDRLNRAEISYKPLFTEQENKKREEEYAKRVEDRAKFYEGNREYREQEARRIENEKQNKLRKEAYENAKRRYKSLSPIKKLWLTLSKNDIYNYSPNTNLETLDSLYRGKKR